MEKVTFESVFSQSVSSPNLQALLSQTMQLCLLVLILILQVLLSLLGLSTQGLYLQHQDPPLSGQHQQLSLGAFCLAEEWMKP